jgi:hypothetical protein
MAKIEDLVKRISDEKLRDEIAAEVRELKKHKQFGLVFISRSSCSPRWMK